MPPARTHAHANTRTLTHAQAHSHSRAHTHTHAHALMHKANMHAHTCTRRHTLTSVGSNPGPSRTVNAKRTETGPRGVLGANARTSAGEIDEGETPVQKPLWGQNLKQPMAASCSPAARLEDQRDPTLGSPSPCPCVPGPSSSSSGGAPTAQPGSDTQVPTLALSLTPRFTNRGFSRDCALAFPAGSECLGFTQRRTQNAESQASLCCAESPPALNHLQVRWGHGRPEAQP